MRILLVRHGEAFFGSGIMRPDAPLSERGREQCERLARRLERIDFDMAVVSTVERAVETAAILGRGRALPMRSCEWLEDLRTPDWTGVPTNQVRALIAGTRDWSPERQWEGFDAGESVRDFTARVLTGLMELLAELGMCRGPGELPIWDERGDVDSTILVVAHKGSNAAMLSHLLGSTPCPWEWDRFPLDHASVTAIGTARIGAYSVFSLQEFNDVGHLSDDLRSR